MEEQWKSKAERMVSRAEAVLQRKVDEALEEAQELKGKNAELLKKVSCGPPSGRQTLGDSSPSLCSCHLVTTKGRWRRWSNRWACWVGRCQSWSCSWQQPGRRQQTH